MRKLLFTLFMLLGVCYIQAAGVFKVNGEVIEKTPALITMDGYQAGYLQVKFTDGSVVSYNMNLIEYYPNEPSSSIKETKQEDGFWQVKGRVGDVLRLEGITPGAEISIYSASGVQEYRGKSNSEHTTVDVSRLSQGVYILRVGRQSVKFIKE